MNKLVHPRFRNYIFLIPLFAAVIFYELAYVGVGISIFQHGKQMPGEPFSVSAECTVGDVDDSAKKAGIHDGDHIISIGGQTITSGTRFDDMLHSHRPGDKLPVMVMPKNGSAPRMEMVPVPPLATQALTLGATLLSAVIILMSLFCVAVAIYVAALRPYDSRALILFGLLLGVSQVASTFNAFAFPPSLLMFVVVYRTLISITWPIWMALFGLYFPHAFAWDRRRPWIKYLLIVPLTASAMLVIVDEGAGIINFAAIAPLDHILNTKAADMVGLALSISAISSFFVCIGFKFGRSTNKDARRRLRILLAGSFVSLTPLFLFILIRVALRDTGRSMPEWAVVVVVLLFCIFPLTLAHVIVVDRAMDLKMVIRQGVRYGLARTGVRVALFIVVGVAIAGAEVSLVGSKLPTTEQFTILGVTIAVIIGLGRILRTRVLQWVDRRFFREAYNADQILEELSDNVRTIVEESLLLDTVTTSIAKSLHVSNIAVLLNGDGFYRPIHCHGIHLTAPVQLPENGPTIEYLKGSKDPPRIYHDDHRNWVHDAPQSEIEALKELQSQLLLPVGFKSNLVGVLSLGPKRSDQPYSRSDVQLLKSVAVQTGLALENSRLTNAIATEMAQREKLNREIEIAREVQERLFPQKLDPIPGLDYFGACRPALGVGGDYYDFLRLANGNFGIAIGDVSGKGIAAALLMASLQASLRGQAMLGQVDIARVMCNVNQLVFDATPINRYATFFYGEYNRDTRLFTYVNAGHNPPIILRRVEGNERHVIRLSTGGPVVGLFRNAPYQQASLILEPGDLFLGFTDGISEAMNNAEEEWGEERMIPALRSCATLTATEIVPSMMRDADLFVNGAPQHDDMTMVVMKLLAA
ncbi:MAG TPA: SpoIIE family protein phosphatase [Bryobacteraceae bacterium]|nr:SpoIIE family protein phosphatase [Bryobacteraceae bacterium]